jgi:hypothetical protein
MAFQQQGRPASYRGVNRTKLPALPPPNDPRFGEALKEVLEQMNGLRGDAQDRVVTFRDLEDSGLAKGIVEAGVGAGANTGSGGGTGSDRPVLTVPPAVQDFQANGAFSVVLLSWGPPGYANHAYTEVARASVNDINQAIPVGYQPARMHTDTVGGSFEGYYWVRHVSTAGVKGPWSASVQASTPDDPEWILEQLTGDIVGSDLWDELQTNLGVEGLAEQWTVKVATTVDGQTVVGGIGLAANGPESDAPGTIDFGVLADRFWVAAPGVDYSEADQLIPFVIQDGKVWINEAGIREATIKTLQVQDAFLDNMTAAKGTLGEANINIANIFNALVQNYIQSDQYSQGVRGWRINRDGTAEFNELTLRARLQSISGQAYIDFSADAGQEGEFVLGNVQQGNYISFKYEPAVGARILRIRGDVLLRNYEPGNTPLHFNDSTRSSTSSILAGDFLSESWRNPTAQELQNMTVLKSTVVTREGVLSADFEYRGSGAAPGGDLAVFYLCIERVNGSVTRLRSYYRSQDGVHLGNGWHRANFRVDIAVKPNEKVQVRFAYRRQFFSDGTRDTAFARNLRAYIGFYPEETSLL